MRKHGWFLTVLLIAAMVRLSAASVLAEDSRPQAHLRPLDQVVGMEVRDSQGKSVGKIRDILINMQTGRVVYVLVASGGSSSTTHMVPWAALSHRQKAQPWREYMALPVNTEKLAEEPKPPPNLTDEEYSRKIHMFYGISPYRQEQPPEAEKR